MPSPGAAFRTTKYDKELNPKELNPHVADRLVEVEQYHRGRWTPLSDVFERAPLAEMPQARRQFEATFRRVGHVPGRNGASLLTGVSLDGRFVADHLWVHQTWGHLAAGDRCCFYATVVPYTRRDGTTEWTLDDANCLVVLRDGV